MNEKDVEIGLEKVRSALGQDVYQHVVAVISDRWEDAVRVGRMIGTIPIWTPMDGADEVQEALRFFLLMKREEGLKVVVVFVGKIVPSLARMADYIGLLDGGAGVTRLEEDGHVYRTEVDNCRGLVLLPADMYTEMMKKGGDANG